MKCTILNVEFDISNKYKIFQTIFVLQVYVDFKFLCSIWDL